MTDTQQPVVEQCDRDAADAQIGAMLNGDGRARLAAGRMDDLSLVQAFARHRLAERERAARVADAYSLEMFGKWERANGAAERVALDAHGYAGKNIAAAIRSGKEPAA